MKLIYIAIGLLILSVIFLPDWAACLVMTAFMLGGAIHCAVTPYMGHDAGTPPAK